MCDILRKLFNSGPWTGEEGLSHLTTDLGQEGGLSCAFGVATYQDVDMPNMQDVHLVFSRQTT